MDRGGGNAQSGRSIKGERVCLSRRVDHCLDGAIPLRRRTFAALRIGKQLVKSGNLWALDIGPEDTKNRQALEFPLSAELSARIGLYLDKFRKRIPGAVTHDGLWPSNKGRAMDDGTIYDMVRRRTCKAFGFPVNLHRFRNAAMTFWSIHDPKNVRGPKICSDTRHSLRLKSTTSCRSHEWRAVNWRELWTNCLVRAAEDWIR